MRPSRKRKRPSWDSADLGTDQIDPNLRLEKYSCVWDAFCEEYVESVEQLPLSIHRNFKLLSDLEYRFSSLESVIPQNIREYVHSRQMIKRQSSVQDRYRWPIFCGRLLVDISSQALSLYRIAEEKANLAQATYDAIDRHVRLLDESIKELAPQLKSDIPDPVEHQSLIARSSFQTRRERKAHLRVSSPRKVQIARRPGQLGIDADNSYSPGVYAKGEALAWEVVYTSPDNVDITASSATGDMPIDPNEPRYCYCGGVSFGEMIACDGANCEGEWFHLGCVGLSEAPRRGKWYCDDCKEGKRRLRKRR